MRAFSHQSDVETGASRSGTRAPQSAVCGTDRAEMRALTEWTNYEVKAGHSIRSNSLTSATRPPQPHTIFVTLMQLLILWLLLLLNLVIVTISKNAR